MAVGPMQLLLIVLVIVLLFGASRLGDIGKGLGEGIRNFKKGMAGDDEDERNKSKASKQKPEKDSDEA